MEVEKVMSLMQCAGCLESRGQSSCVEDRCRMLFFRDREPQTLSYASVAITLDNADHQLPVDYHEVTVTRKLYRSGESEYLINGTACRLKDVNELFYDTGIGKEGYSIIGQGQIDKILSGKPEERRELLMKRQGLSNLRDENIFLSESWKTRDRISFVSMIFCQNLRNKWSH